LLHNQWFGNGGLRAVSWYLTIRGAPDYSRFAAAAPLLEFLAAMPELSQTGPVAFQASDGQPWVAVMMAVCDSTGNYASDGAFLPRVNVVQLVCSYSGDPAWYDALAGRIAGFLGWSAFDDHEERQVWPPGEQRHAEPKVAPDCGGIT
jgi:hypothetical protein